MINSAYAKEKSCIEAEENLINFLLKNLKMIFEKPITILYFSNADREWNMREMIVQDPDGHIIRFGQRIECE